MWCTTKQKYFQLSFHIIVTTAMCCCLFTEILSEESGNILRQHERQHFISGQGGLLAETMFMAAKVYSQTNMHREVVEIYENFATIFPNDPRLATIKGMIDWMESNPDFYMIPISKTSWWKDAGMISP